MFSTFLQSTNKDPLQLNAKDTLQQDRHNIHVTGPPRSQLQHSPPISMSGSKNRL